ncbi:glycosyltransferase family 2 protein [Jatrophihabitans sp. YIM 134969]
MSADAEVVVAIVSYRRPDDLRTALAAVVPEARRLDPPAGVLVVDNDPEGSARDVAAAVDGVGYVVEPAPGIAAARNRAMDHSAGSRFLVWLDDDEHPEPGWLAALVGTARSTGAAAVAGPVVSVFDTAPDAWVSAGRFFDRRRLPTGTRIDQAATNNLLLDRDQLDGLRFDPAFGLTGGSDTLFTRTLARRGRLLVWCDEAVVLDRVPADRVSRSWVVRRAFRMSNTGVRVDLVLAGGTGARLTVRARDAARGLTRVAGGSARMLLGVVRRSPGDRVRGLRTVVRGAGMVSAATGYVYAEYRRDRAGRGWRPWRR